MDLVSGDVELQMSARVRRHCSLTCLPRSAHVSSSQLVDRLQYAEHPGFALVRRHRPTISSQDYGQKILQSRPYGLPLTLRFMRYPYPVTLEEPFPTLPNRLQAHYARAAPSSEYPVMCSDPSRFFLPPAFHGMFHLCRTLVVQENGRTGNRSRHPPKAVTSPRSQEVIREKVIGACCSGDAE